MNSCSVYGFNLQQDILPFFSILKWSIVIHFLVFHKFPTSLCQFKPNFEISQNHKVWMKYDMTESLNLNEYKQQQSRQPGMIKMAAIAKIHKIHWKEHWLEYLLEKHIHTSPDFRVCPLKSIETWTWKDGTKTNKKSTLNVCRFKVFWSDQMSNMFVCISVAWC